ncbi:MAG: hypothetical protein IKT00_13995 [Prevotella sp.]|nr:hypothetical protein [Prevotella sp.]
MPYRNLPPPDNKEEYSHHIEYSVLFAGVQVISILVGLIRNKLVALILGHADGKDK